MQTTELKEFAQLAQAAAGLVVTYSDSELAGLYDLVGGVASNPTLVGFKAAFANDRGIGNRNRNG
jgi:hypothetical protein